MNFKFKEIADRINNFDLSTIDLTDPLAKYRRIMEKCDPEKREFQKAFNGFYRVRRNRDWQAGFYDVFRSSEAGATFKDVLRSIYDKTNRVECSFASKMLHTIDTCKPIWDKNVLNALGLSKEYKHYKKSAEDKIKSAVKVYEKIEEFYDWYLKTDCKAVLDAFNKKYPDNHISDVKIVDFILWKLGV